jgi:hypothetical protein
MLGEKGAKAMKSGRWGLAIIAVLIAVPGVAAAYVGPGAGLGALGALLAVLASVLMAIGIVLYWPFRMLIRRLRATRPTPKREDAQDAQGPAARSGVGGDP